MTPFEIAMAACGVIVALLVANNYRLFRAWTQAIITIRDHTSKQQKEAAEREARVTALAEALTALVDQVAHVQNARVALDTRQADAFAALDGRVAQLRTDTAGAVDTLSANLSTVMEALQNFHGIVSSIMEKDPARTAADVLEEVPAPDPVPEPKPAAKKTVRRRKPLAGDTT